MSSYMSFAAGFRDVGAASRDYADVFDPNYYCEGDIYRSVAREQTRETGADLHRRHGVFRSRIYREGNNGEGSKSVSFRT